MNVESDFGALLAGRVAARGIVELVIDVAQPGRSSVGLPELLAVQSARPIGHVEVLQVRPAFALHAVEEAERTLFFVIAK